MHLSRRTFFALAGLGAVGLAGCSNRLPAVDVTAPGFGDGASGTINVWCRSETQDGIQTMVEAFHQAQDRIRIRLTPIPAGQYVTKLATAIRGSRPPDLVDIDDINSALFFYRDVFSDITPLVDELPYKGQLSPGHLGLATREDRYYGVPFLGDFSVLFCNSELFDRAGVDLEETTGSFDGYLEASRAISALGEDISGWLYPGNATGALGFTVQPHVWAADSQLMAGDVGDQQGDILGNEPLRRTLEMMRTMWTEGLVPSGSYADDASRWYADFVDGRIGMLPCSYGSVVPNASEELLAKTEVRLLAGPDGGQAFFTGGDNFSLPNGSSNPSAAWEFVRFCLELEQQQNLPAGGFAPIRGDAATEQFAEQYPLMVPPLESIDAGYAPRTLSYSRLFNQSDGPWLEIFRRAVFDGEIDAALEEGQDGFDTVLEQGDA
ncbi:sugar ABC transporter substrate-binding protein [Nesterenkonia halophila]|uniref:ABC transporter substrate-binding protein n=1 Tax=Nesterenkonia halophila TaxID=302044 RepID=UPI0012928C7D|nr:sugar ABC transporter substrate-binding protein [Nesterenkonia halophila]